jgi:hypothetical protein
MNNTISDIKWATLESEEYEDELHVVPVIDGELMGPHTLKESCPCHPEQELYLDAIVYNHNVIH